MSIQSGDGNSVHLQGRDSENGSQSKTDLVQVTSSPTRTGPRPVAPPLNFASSRKETAKSPESPSEPPRPLESSAPSVPSALPEPAESFAMLKTREPPSASTQTPSDETAAPDDSRPDDSRDDVSVPPVGLDSAFFDEQPHADSSLEIDTRDPRVALKLTATVARRRAHLARYVTAAVVFASALCAAAVVKTTARSHEPPPRVAATSEVAPQPELALNAAPTRELEPSTVSTAISASTDTNKAEQAPQPGPVEPQNSASAASPSPGESAASPPSDTAAVAPAAAAPTAAPAASSTEATEAPLDPKEVAKEAAKAKVKARSALEWGKMSEAIASGERSVELDPTDAESWLILGAAYQEKGDSKNAMRAFKTCLDQGKRGPRNECAAMFR
jgi:hypothetical protein